MAILISESGRLWYVQEVIKEISYGPLISSDSGNEVRVRSGGEDIWDDGF